MKTRLATERALIETALAAFAAMLSGCGEAPPPPPTTPAPAQGAVKPGPPTAIGDMGRPKKPSR